MNVRRVAWAACFSLLSVPFACLSMPDTFPCASDGTCPTTSSGVTTCVSSMCLPACQTDSYSNSCASGTKCIKIGTKAKGTRDGFCSPSCTSSSECQNGLECDGKNCLPCGPGSTSPSCSGVDASAAPPVAQPTPAATPGDPYGSVWNETEAAGACHGTWSRIGSSHSFEAYWSDCNANATVTITITGSNVSASRTGTTDGNDCTYTGTLSGNGTSVSGTYSCTRVSPGSPNWSATIH